MSLEETEDISKRSHPPQRADNMRMWKGRIPTFMMVSPETVLRALPGAEPTLKSSADMVQQKGLFLGLSINRFMILLSLV